MLFVKRLTSSATIPARASDGAAGYDLTSSEHVVIPSRGRALVSTGIAIAIPEGCYGRIAPRSGLAVKCGIDVGAGVIDADYRGEVKVLLFNFSDEDCTVAAGLRMAQLVLEQIAIPPVEEVEDLDSTKRGAGGFGSTGHGPELNWELGPMA